MHTAKVGEKTVGLKILQVIDSAGLGDYDIGVLVHASDVESIFRLRKDAWMHQA